MTAHRRPYPAERSSYCPDCGTAPCSHPVDELPGPDGVDLLAVVLLLLIVAGVGLWLGWHLSVWAAG